MMALLPALAMGLLALYDWRRSSDLRASVLRAAVLWGMLVVLSTEGLSAFEAVAPVPLASVWAAVVFGLALAIRFQRPHLPPQGSPDPSEGWRPTWPSVSLVAVVLAGTLTCSLLSPPNTWDAMAYHLPRVMHWIQNRSVRHYPTWTLRQIFFPPWAEFVLLHLRLLSGSDRLFALPQWFAMAGSLVGVSAVARELGASTRGQWFATVFAATIPMSIMQASSTQNDLTATFWFVCLAFFLVRGWGTDAGGMFVGAALGLATLTKGTSFVYAPCLLLVGGGAWVVQRRLRALMALVLAICVALLLNAQHLRRNMNLFGNPLGPKDELSLYKNKALGPRLLASNLLRNAVIHFAGPPRWNAWLEDLVLQAHAAIGLDVNDPRITWSSPPFSLSLEEQGVLHEEGTPSGRHVLLTLASLATLAFGAGSHRRGPLLLYSVALCLAALLFCAVLKWQHWHVRQHLALLVLAAPIVGATLEWRLPKTRMAEGLFVALLAISLDCVFFNRTRPLLGPTSIFVTPRLDQYFASRPETEEAFVRDVAPLRDGSCDRVGLRSGQNEYEYMVWVLLENPANGHRPRIEHVGVSNASRRLAKRPPFAGFEPCVVLEPKIHLNRVLVSDAP